MASDPSQLIESVGGAVELGRLLADTLGAVARAQEDLDAATAARVEAFREQPRSGFHVPPLWHVFSNVEVEIALSASVAQVRTTEGKLEPRLFSRTVSSNTVALHGYQAASGLTVRVQMQPRAALPTRLEEGSDV